MARKGPLCLRLPDDLDEAITALSEESGMTVSEWVRGVLTQAVYGTPPNVDDGYHQGRQIGYSAALAQLRAAMQALPDNVDEGRPFAQSPGPGRPLDE